MPSRSTVTAGLAVRPALVVRPALAAGPVLAAALVTVWLAVDPHTPDLAAQVYRVGLFKSIGLAVWDEHWYAGHHLPGYSLLFPPLGALLGVRTVGALCAFASTILFGRLVASEFGRGAAAGTAAFAVAAAGDVWLGRLAFALGVTFALAAGLALHRERRSLAAVLALACAAASPVAGLLLGLAGLTVSVHERAPRGLLALSLPGAAVVLPLALLFPEGGSQPFPTLSFLATAAVVLAFLLVLPPGQRLLRTGGLIYLAACVGCLLVRSPIGSNIARYAVLLAAPLLLCALDSPAGRRRDAAGGVLARGGAASSVAAGLALAGIATWVLWGPVRETAAVAGSPATSASYYVPLERFLERVPGPVRVEVPLTRTHWEAALLAPKVSLARGWEKQIDERYDGVLLRTPLTAAGYLAWLRREAVAYVALPDVQLDPSSAAEGRLVRAGLPYLRPVFRSAHWQVFAVASPTPLASAPAALTRLGHDSFSLSFASPGTTLVRIHYTRYWALKQGRGCVRPGAEGFTSVSSRAAGPVEVAASFSLSRAFGARGSCR